MPITGCYNVDECKEGTAGCHEMAACIDQNPGFECKCNPGYQGDGHSCEDVNECLGRSGCDRNAKCENTEGASLHLFKIYLKIKIIFINNFMAKTEKRFIRMHLQAGFHWRWFELSTFRPMLRWRAQLSSTPDLHCYERFGSVQMCVYGRLYRSSWKPK